MIRTEDDANDRFADLAFRCQAENAELKRKLRVATEALNKAKQQLEIAYLNGEPRSSMALIEAGCIINVAFRELEKPAGDGGKEK